MKGGSPPLPHPGKTTFEKPSLIRVKIALGLKTLVPSALRRSAKTRLSTLMWKN